MFVGRGGLCWLGGGKEVVSGWNTSESLSSHPYSLMLSIGQHQRAPHPHPARCEPPCPLLAEGVGSLVTTHVALESLGNLPVEMAA